MCLHLPTADPLTTGTDVSLQPLPRCLCPSDQMFWNDPKLQNRAEFHPRPARSMLYNGFAVSPPHKPLSMSSATGQQAPGAEQVEFMTCAERGRGAPGGPGTSSRGQGGPAGAALGGRCGRAFGKGAGAGRGRGGFRIGSVPGNAGRRGPGSSLKLGTKPPLLPGRAHACSGVNQVVGAGICL